MVQVQLVEQLELRPVLQELVVLVQLGLQPLVQLLRFLGLVVVVEQLVMLTVEKLFVVCSVVEQLVIDWLVVLE